MHDGELQPMELQHLADLQAVWVFQGGILGLQGFNTETQMFADSAQGVPLFHSVGAEGKGLGEGQKSEKSKQGGFQGLLGQMKDLLDIKGIS